MSKEKYTYLGHTVVRSLDFHMKHCDFELHGVFIIHLSIYLFIHSFFFFLPQTIT